MQERGSQYADTWGKDACWHITKAVAKQFLDKELTPEQCEMLALAVFVDQKYSRSAGSYRQDTIVDLISYLSALADITDKFNNE